MSHQDTIIHLFAGGVGGTAGAIATCPLEVVKTRLQSSVANFDGKDCKKRQLLSQAQGRQQRAHLCTVTNPRLNTINFTLRAQNNLQKRGSIGLYNCLRHIIETEGPRALFKGLGPNLIGVAPSRAIYFSSYSKAKCWLNERFTPNTPIVHIGSAAMAGFTASTATNPIWFIKTRLQLDQRVDRQLTALKCIKQIYQQNGLIGFYKGITASYFGITETVIHFVIYESLKQRLREYHMSCGYDCDQKTSRDFLEFMCAGATSKTCASIIAYPHEVARTRLREEGNKYKSFVQTLITVFKEEGYVGLYRGLTTQLVRQIPNTAIMMATYEAVVYLLQRDMYEDD